MFTKHSIPTLSLRFERIRDFTGKKPDCQLTSQTFTKLKRLVIEKSDFPLMLAWINYSELFDEPNSIEDLVFR